MAVSEKQFITKLGSTAFGAAFMLSCSLTMISMNEALSQTAATATHAGGSALPRMNAGVSYSRISPPQAGVKLIEEVFSRVRSTPQVALAKNNLNVALNEPQLGPTDYRLAIRPKQSAKFFNPSPTIALIEPNSTTPPLGLTNALGGTSTYVDARSSNSPVLIADKTTSAPPAAPEAWLGNRQFPYAAPTSTAQSKGVWEKNPSVEQEAAALDAAPAAPLAQAKKSAVRGVALHSKPQDIASLTNRMVDSFNTLQQAERAQIAALPVAATAPAAGRFNFAPHQWRADEAKATKTALVKHKASAGLASDVLEETHRDAESLTKRKLANGFKDVGGIALLPPNVITGIPLVRLGISETQAGSALKAVGTMKAEKVNKWTVWTWQRSHVKAATALQLFMRNGLLDAMRIFDQGLIAPDFGVTLGDELSQVKERFGEPAFILPEPTPGAGQNYIYPISQVGFQLARPAPDQQPRVVSVLIFNVK